MFSLLQTFNARNNPSYYFIVRTKLRDANTSSWLKKCDSPLFILLLNFDEILNNKSLIPNKVNERSCKVNNILTQITCLVLNNICLKYQFYPLPKMNAEIVI